MMKDLLRIADLSAADLELLLDQAASAAADPHQHADLLRGDTVALYFATPSTRTRVALQTAVAHLGGMPLALGPAELQQSRGETIQDTARVISRYVRALVVRTVADADLHQAANLLPVAQALLCLLLEGRLQGHTDTMTVPDDTGRLAAAISAAIKGEAIGDQLTPAAGLWSGGVGQDHRPRKSFERSRTERSRTSLPADSS